MKILFQKIFDFSNKNALGVSLPASKNTLGIAGGSIYEVTVWAWSRK